ncbi:Hypothetical predicted protein, partial [Pelobates cultripes]
MADTQPRGQSGPPPQSPNTNDSLTTRLDGLFEAFWAKIAARHKEERSKLLDIG